MAGTDGATVRSDDPVLQNALAEMESEGVNLDAPMGDLEHTAASQPVAEPSAAPSAAATPAGDPGTSTPAEPVADPYEGTEQFTYGDAKTPFEGIYVVPGQGALIPEDQLPAVQQFFVQAQQYQQAAHQSAQQTAAFERASEWKRTDETGKEQTFSGIQGLAEQRLDYARVLVERNLYEAAFKDPTLLFGLLAQDANGNIVHNTDAIERLALRAALARGEAENAVRQDFASRLQPPAPTFDAGTVSQYAPSLIQQAAGADLPLLSKDQQALLAQHMSRYVRDVQPGEQGLHGKIVDAAFGELVKSFVAQAKASQASVTTTETATKHNAAMDRGRVPPKKAAPVVATKAAEPEKKPSKAELWDKPFRDFMAEEGIPIR